MLHSIGKRAQAQDLVDLLLECHTRIRAFVRLAGDVGRLEEAKESEVVEACRRCERYFVEALPLHVADEEESVLPRLRALDDARVTAALELMQAQHREHEPVLAALLAALAAVRAEPAGLALRAELRRTADAIGAAFEAHLTLEERDIFPVVRARMSAGEQTRVTAELRARRQPAAPPAAG